MSNSFCSYGGAAFTNNSNEWRTPAWLFNELDNEFHFELDAAASDDNHLCERYFTKDLDGLSQEWDGNVFCNPPYGREIGKWCEKAATTHGGGLLSCLSLPGLKRHTGESGFSRMPRRFVSSWEG